MQYLKNKCASERAGMRENAFNNASDTQGTTIYEKENDVNGCDNGSDLNEDSPIVSLINNFRI